MKSSEMEVSYIQHCGSDLSVSNAARVSFKKHKFTLDEGDSRLIKYLADHKHTSPFNHSFLTVHVKAPIFVARQLVKHKFMPWNEVSRRYVDDDPEFYFPEYWRQRADNVKQGSSHERCEKMYEKDFNGDTSSDWVEITVSQSLSNYRAMRTAEVAPEQARMVLPQNTMTEWYWSGTLGAFLDMLKLRLAKDTQYETRLVAEKIKDIIQPRFPVATKAYLGDLI